MSMLHRADVSRTLLFLAAALTTHAAAADDAVKLLPTGIELPRSIGPLSLEGERYVYPGAGFGAHHQYTGDGWLLFIYTYDKTLEDLPDGADSNEACREFEDAKRGFLDSPAYENGVLTREALVPLLPPEPLPQVREAAIEADMNGKHAIIYVWVTTAGKQFLKVQLMTPDRNRDRVPEVRRAVLTTLGTAIAPHLVADPDAKLPENGIQISGLDAKDDEMEFGFAYLGTLSAILAQQPERGPVCGGVYEPSFEEALGAYKMGLTLSEDSPPRSHALKAMLAAQTAGFLDELVWTYLRSESWGPTPPDGLDLAAFAPWQERNVKRFSLRPFGAVVAARPRPLPVVAD